MKKLLKSTFMLFAITALSFTAMSMSEGKAVPSNDEGIHCKVTSGDVTVSCWFCNCAKLAEAMQ